ncbi:tyrosine-type recombinase/integrase [Desulfitibacter alkalitolerans]|uniref:tyrosine-type recombinase/integrase n=1 Tax=Desulfitibacter alkalitolerans TaxID=264641 RepID=UPI000480789E|nr:tyrosine-type recombinase/integrase [Desulfitibacter alkalitolerans]
MPRLSERIKLSNELKKIPISDLIVKAKLLVKAKGYQKSTIWHYNERFNDLQHFADLLNAEKLSAEFIAQYIEEGKQRSPNHARGSVQRKALLNLTATAVDAAHVFTIEKEDDQIRTKFLRESLNAYEQHLKVQEQRKDSIKSYLQVATKFLLYLDTKKKSVPSKVTVIDIREFITDLGGKWSHRSLQIVPSLLKTYLKFAEFPIDLILFASFHTLHKRKPVHAMSTENIEVLWKYTESSDVDLRSKAIVTILLATGMRPVDITGLKLDDINWSNGSIGFIQSKTGEWMNIELFPVMGSAIIRYMTEERPKGTGLKYIFLTKGAPYRRISPENCNHILKNALKKAGVTFVADGLHCPRALRRSLVSRMIAKGIPIQKAAASIGHVGEDSVDLYTELDMKKMKSICLPIPNSMKEWLMT